MIKKPPRAGHVRRRESKAHRQGGIKTLPTVGPDCLQGTAAMTGEIDFGDGPKTAYVTQRCANHIPSHYLFFGGDPDNPFFVNDRLSAILSGNGGGDVEWIACDCGYLGKDPSLFSVRLRYYAIRDRNGCYRIVCRGPNQGEPEPAKW